MASTTSPLRLLDQPFSSAAQEHSRGRASDTSASSSPTSSLRRKDSCVRLQGNGSFPFSTRNENGISGRTQSFRDVTDVRTMPTTGVSCPTTVSQCRPKASRPTAPPPFSDRCSAARTRAHPPCGRSWTVTLGLLVLQMLAFSSMSDAQFQGEVMTCDLEGEDVPVPPEVAKVKPCITCTCVNKIVKCSKKRCPSLEGCYWRLTKPGNECCQECKVCVHQGITYKHGSRWSDGCQHYECQSGVLTVSQKHCHAPCYVPLPPLGSGCCPRCEGCWLEGRRVPEGEVVTSKIDPCVRCVCFDGKLTCEKRSCPVLSCSESKQVLSHDGCCMTCKGTRPMITPPGGRCFLTGYLYLSGAERSVDPCTTCTCNNGYITCERRTCPVLNCSQEFQVMHENECCPSCSAAAQLESVCHKFGTIYKDGDTWQLDKCTSCSCDNGKVTCHVLPCDFYMKPCPPGYRRVELDSECCPRCEKAPGVCVVFGDPHYRTFDGLLFNFQAGHPAGFPAACYPDVMYLYRKSTDSFALHDDVALLFSCVCLYFFK